MLKCETKFGLVCPNTANNQSVQTEDCADRDMNRYTDRLVVQRVHKQLLHKKESEAKKLTQL